ncbi:hypothetical protein Tco_0822332 [Tanacetum coccineum]|uniref:Uncharacterized protein n=1 Tax=Tanacetum coccineum TaxID=301880 RepID=A0ABQ5AFQ0_9ASTR
MKKMRIVAGDDVRNLVTLSEHQSDGIKTFMRVLNLNRLKETLEDSAKRWRQEYKATPYIGTYPDEMGVSSRDNLLPQLMSTWMVFGGNTHDLGSFGKETDEITTLHQSRRRKGHTDHGDGVIITCDGVGTSKRQRQEIGDGVKT